MSPDQAPKTNERCQGDTISRERGAAAFPPTTLIATDILRYTVYFQDVAIPDTALVVAMFHKFALANFFPPCFQEDMRRNGDVSGEKSAMGCQEHDNARARPMKCLTGTASASILFS